MLKKILSNFQIFKISFLLLLATSALNTYNSTAFSLNAGIVGYSIFVVSTIYMCLFLFTNFSSSIDNKRLQIQITSYFFLTGLIQFVIIIRKFYIESKIDSNFMMIYVGFFILSIFLNKKYTVISMLSAKKSYRKEINLTSIILTIFLQFYLAEPKYCNQMIVSFTEIISHLQPFKAIISIIESGPKN